ncbi:hypothetical protein SAMN05216389_11137 [Oceanobacillus limi]|uniref:Uncharacterized protein n=1 Tax=Oceanobacillus limi TaxID=930131 RepID=A0A1I0ECA8_9BACI|nr:hypothetical protein [Oceanobacillus limi]SET42803.1 hypothetical protein SAMN05216389_11137 [Oceanobacillus limi]
MSKYQSGADALNALNEESNGGGSNAEFSPFKSGTTYTVKVLGTSDLITFFSYGIYKQLNSFVAKNPSKKSAKGYPVDNLTAFDKAWKYHKDLSEDFSDKHGQEAGKYRAKQRFAMGFFDLDSGEPIIIDVSKPQAQAIHGSIKKYEKKIGKIAFELSKEGSGTNTTVSLTPVLDMDEDLTDKQRANFDKAPESFDMALFDGILFEKDEDEMIEALQSVGFDVSLIGLQPKKEADNSGDNDGVEAVEDGEISEDKLPF